MSQVQVEGFGFTPIGKVRAKRIKWLIKDILPAGVLVFLSAQAKAGKSTLALHASLCLTTGGMFLERFRCRKTTVLIYSLEDDAAETRAKAGYMLKGRRFPKKLLMSHAVVVDLPADFSRIEQDIVESKARVVILDTLRRSDGLNEDNSTDMAPVLREFRRIVREYAVTDVLIHHAGHKIEDSDNPGDYCRGTSDFNASWETLIGLQKRSASTSMRVFHKYRADLPQMAYKTVISEQVDVANGGYPITGLVFEDPDQQEHERDDQTVLTGLSQPLSGNQLQTRLVGTLSRPKIDRALERLQGRGQVCSVGRGRAQKWERVAVDTSTNVERR